MTSLWFGYPPNAASIHQEREIPCQGRKGGRFFQGVKGFQVKFLELNILYGRHNQLPGRHLWSTHSARHSVRPGETGCLGAHSSMGETDTAGNDSRMHSWCCGDPRERWLLQSGVEESGNSWEEAELHLVPLGKAGLHFSDIQREKNMFSFPKFVLFQFYQLPWLQ